MNEPGSHSTRAIWLGLGLTGALLILAFLLAALSIRQHSEKPLPIYGQVAEFTLTNQDAQPVSLRDLQGKIWIADIIFTRCPGPCLNMTRQMSELQAALDADGAARLVSLTTDPTYDSPAILKAYGRRFNADFQRWIFLTGTPKQIAALAIDSLKLTAIEKKPQDRGSTVDLFVHSTIFVLVDRQGRLRGIFESTGEGVEPRKVRTEILAAIRRLERET